MWRKAQNLRLGGIWFSYRQGNRLSWWKIFVDYFIPFMSVPGGCVYLDFVKFVFFQSI